MRHRSRIVTTREQCRARQRHARARRRDRRLARAVAVPSRAAASCRRRSRWPSANGATARRCCARSRSATTSARRLNLSLNAYEFRDGRPFDAQLRADVRRRRGGRRAGRLRLPSRCATACRTPRSRRPASRAGCATRNTSRKRSTSAACRRATASPPRRWSRMASPASKTCSRASAISSSPTAAVANTRPKLVRELGSTYEIMNTNIKRWSVGSPIQAPLDSLLELIRDTPHQSRRRRKARVRVAHQGANTVDNRTMPDICMQHMCAVMLLDGIVTFESAHDEKRMSDRKVLDAARSRIELVGDDELERAPCRPPGHRRTHTEGRPRAASITPKPCAARAQNPMTRDEVDEKMLRPDRARDRQSARAQAVRRGVGHREHQGRAQAAAAAAGQMIRLPAGSGLFC